MKKYLQNRIANIYEKLNQVNSKEEYDVLIKTLNELELALYELNNPKSQIIGRKKATQLAFLNIDENLFNFIKQLVDVYANMPLLDTESYISYPMLGSTNKMSYNTMFKFWNELYNKELPSKKKLSFGDKVKIFETKGVKRFFLGSGRCIVYQNFLERKNKLLLERFYNVRDLVIPCGKAIKLIDEFKSIDYDNYINILESYMRARAIQLLQQYSFEGEAHKLDLLNTDNLIVEARNLSPFCNKHWSELSPILKGRFLSFFDKIIGYELAKNNNICLEDLINTINQNKREHKNDFSDIGISNNTIMDNTRQLAKRLKSTATKK